MVASWGYEGFVPKSKLRALKDDCFTIRCVLTAHRVVLAGRTPFFRSELSGPMKENKMQHISIDDVEPSVFKALLHFIYTDALPDNRDLKKNTTLQHLLVAADRYGLDRLAAMCEGELCRSIDVQTVATTLTLAKQHCRERLKDVCVDFMSARDVFDVVKKTNGFKHLVTSCPEVISDILQENLPLPEVGVFT
ncbi:BTB/POZ and MATH domain-containing protein 3-like [Aegilops tauschii subsp. strangulata]|uniref:Speckle-type POZ protein n=1 Tax=Aegilops tauschii TaxID=37682 RepID=M8BYJ1_AEGTA